MKTDVPVSRNKKTKVKDPPRLVLIHWSVLGVSIILFLIACLCPTLVFNSSDGSRSTMAGYEVLFLGGLAAFIGQFGWFAQIPLLFALFFFLLRFRKISLFCSGLALIISLDSFMLFSQPVPENEGVTSMMTLNHFGPGFYLWMASILTAFLGTLYIVINYHSRSDTKDEESLQDIQNPL